MQHSIRSMIGYAIRATDGDLGKIDEFYFDDKTWTIRYIVVETSNWLSGRKVLISPVAFGKPELEPRMISVDLTCAQVGSSPDIDTERPIYLQHEAELQEHYQWPWRGGYGGTFGTIPLPLSASSKLRPYGSSFLIFTDYCRGVLMCSQTPRTADPMSCCWRLEAKSRFASGLMSN